MYNLHDEADVYKTREDFIAAVNKMNSVFASVHAEIELSLLQTYCASRYGCQAWQLGTPYCDIMNVEWRKAVRRTAGLPRQTRSVLFPGLAGNDNFLSQQERRFARLFNTMSTSSSPAICFVATRASLSAVGVLCRNRVYLATKYQCGRLIKGLLVPPWRGAVSEEAPRVEHIRASQGLSRASWHSQTWGYRTGTWIHNYILNEIHLGFGQGWERAGLISILFDVLHCSKQLLYQYHLYHIVCIGCE